MSTTYRIVEEPDDLQGAYLFDANMSHADMRLANLEGAKMRHANMRGANMTGADMTGANLDGARVTPGVWVIDEDGYIRRAN